MLNPEIFSATFKAHGLYNAEQFVLRLSPKNHALMDRVTAGDFEPGNIEGDIIQAYSTYLHETIHWWQHVGSTSGFVLSMCYPLQLHSTFTHIRKWCSLGPPTKSIKAAAIDGQRRGITHRDERQACANMVLNFTVDFDNFRKWLLDPHRAEDICRDDHFESQGHCFRVVYSDLLENFASQIDPNYEVLPRPENWVAEFDRAASDNVMGYFWGSPIYRRPIGVRELFEGQASFSQMQFLTCSGIGDGNLQAFRDSGMLHGVYEQAFTEFFKRAEIDPPEKVVDPRVALFLLVCDLAINPMEGLLCDITSIPDFVNDADPGMRFLMLCNIVRDNKEYLSYYIEYYSAEEYLEITEFLSERAGFLPPSKGWNAVSQLTSAGTPLSDLMKEHEKFKYGKANVVLRVLISHFFSFNLDKSNHPHFFCWPGIWKSRMKNDDWISALWLKHLSLFSDKETDDGIFIRNKRGVASEDLKNTLNSFFGNIILSDLTRQWVIKDGAFNFDFKWLSEKHTLEYWKKSVEGAFEELFGVKIDDVRIS